MSQFESLIWIFQDFDDWHTWRILNASMDWKKNQRDGNEFHFNDDVKNRLTQLIERENQTSMLFVDFQLMCAYYKQTSVDLH